MKWAYSLGAQRPHVLNIEKNMNSTRTDVSKKLMETFAGTATVLPISVWREIALIVRGKMTPNPPPIMMTGAKNPAKPTRPPMTSVP